MIYNKKTVAKIIQSNIKNLNTQIENYDGVKNIGINHLLSWKKKNIEALHQWEFISDEEMEKYNSSNNSLFTPEIHI